VSFHYPAEWENQKATWLAFPHNSQNWSGARRERITRFYNELIGILSRFQPVKVLVQESWKLPESEARAFKGARFAPEFIPVPTDDIWIRDYGPVFTYDGDRETIAEFKFNAWGAKFPPWEKDNKVPSRIAELTKFPITSVPFIFEGGAIEVNGDGLGITTLSCLTGNHRNPIAALPEMTMAIRDVFGLKDLLVLPAGLHGDHTDGHIDNVARFVAKDRIVMASEDKQDSPNFQILSRNKALLDAWLRKYYGNKAHIDLLPLPPQKKLGKETLPASYMNFIYANGALLYPCYSPEKDAVAQHYFSVLYPGREIIGIDCSTVIEEGGSLHCLSKQEN
jgi:agmatine deiminase